MINNIIGPLLFNKKNRPRYYPGLRAVLAILINMIAVITIQLVNLMVLNKLQREKRVRKRKTAVIVDSSMLDRYVGELGGGWGRGGGKDEEIGENALLDLTDQKNGELVYIW